MASSTSCERFPSFVSDTRLAGNKALGRVVSASFTLCRSDEGNTENAGMTRRAGSHPQRANSSADRPNLRASRYLRSAVLHEEVLYLPISRDVLSLPPEGNVQAFCLPEATTHPACIPLIRPSAIFSPEGRSDSVEQQIGK